MSNKYHIFYKYKGVLTYKELSKEEWEIGTMMGGFDGKRFVRTVNRNLNKLKSDEVLLIRGRLLSF